MWKKAKEKMFNQDGASEIVQTGLVILFGCVVAAVAFVLIDPAIDTGMTTVTGKITNAFTAISGL